MRTLVGLILALLLSTSAFCGQFSVESPAFQNNAKIPVLYTCDGKNISPELNWKNPPQNTQSFALIVTCTDAPTGIFYSWVIFNIPAESRKLAEGANKDLPDGVVVGNNNFDEANYSAPCPVDSQNHHYVFTLYALDATLDLTEGASIPSVLAAIKKHILQETDLTALYNH